MKKDNKIKEPTDAEKSLASWTFVKFKEAMVAKQPYTNDWMRYYNAWNNDLYEKNTKPSYRTNHDSNFIYSSIESMRPILFDNNPRFEAIPVTAEAMEYSLDITAILDYEWERTNMQEKLLANSIYTFTLGTSIIMLPYLFTDKKKDGVDGEVTPIAVSPFNLYPDPLATCVEDAEYLIYAKYIHVNKLKSKYPKKANFLHGSDVTYSELVNDMDRNAKIDNQVLVLEVWCRDYTTIDVEEHCEDGQVIKKTKRRFPNGRVIISAPELGLILEDKENPYESGRFPFFLFKDIDVPFQFWGEGECKWLLSPQKQINDLYNQVIDNAKSTANMQWIVDKNAGIPKGELTNRPGLIIRKNPGTDVHRENPPSMPMYVQQMIETLKADIEVISGIHDVTRGQTPSGVQSAAAIVALQEAAQTRIRLKVQLHENTLGLLGTEWINRIQQFWKFNRLIPRKTNASQQINKMGLNGIEMQPMSNGEFIPQGMMQPEPQHYEFIDADPDRQLNKNNQYKIEVIGTSVLQHNRASMLDQLTRLAQTPAEDGMPMVPREAVLDYLPNANKRLIMQYFQQLKEEQQQQQQQQQMNNESLEMLQQLSQQVQQIAQAVGALQQRADSEDQQKQQDELRYQGYQQGVVQSQAAMNQQQKQGQIPPELYEELAMMDDETLSVTLQQHPEILMDLQNEV